MVKVLVMGNGLTADRIVDLLERAGDEIMIWTVNGDPPPGTKLLREVELEIGLSIMYPWIIPQETIELFPRGIINLHPSLLPYCRGRYPAFWAIVDGKPAGVTLHYIDEGIDTGDIVAQSHVEYGEKETCREIYTHCLDEGVKLFASTWGKIREGRGRRIPQLGYKATYHRGKELPNPDEWFDLTVSEIKRKWRTR